MLVLLAQCLDTNIKIWGLSHSLAIHTALIAFSVLNDIM